MPMTSVESEKQTSKSRSSNVDIKSLDDRYHWFKVSLLDSDTYQPIDYVFRGLTAHEVRVANSKTSLYEKEDYVLRHAVANDVDWHNALAGMSSTLLELIYHTSGLDEQATTVKKAIEWVQTDTGMLEALALVTIPGLNLHTLRHCDPEDYAKYLVVGKEMFEILYQGRVQEPQPQDAMQQGWGPGQERRHTQLPTKPGEVGVQQESFNWHK